MPIPYNGQPNPNPRQPVDIARILLVITTLTALTVGSLYVLRPFLPGLIWATTIVVATWRSAKVTTNALLVSCGLDECEIANVLTDT